MSRKRVVPSVLLLGNGLNLAYSKSSISWDALLKEGGDPRVPAEITLPLSLEVVLRTRDHAGEKMRLKSRELYGTVEEGELRTALRRLLSVGFDEILTTNYGYELEEAALLTPLLSDYRLRKIERSTTNMIDRTFLLHTYSEVRVDGRENRIWHIHGEARRPGTMVIDHYHYGSLLNRFINFYRWRGRLYDRMRNYSEIPKESWLDAFILGEVYILGQGFDFAEMDLWWLLNRKKMMNKRHRRVVFYQPRSDRNYDAKEDLLEVYGVEFRSLGFVLPDKPSRHASEAVKREYRKKTAAVYREFYRAAITDIENEMRS